MIEGVGDFLICGFGMLVCPRITLGVILIRHGGGQLATILGCCSIAMALGSGSLKISLKYGMNLAYHAATGKTLVEERVVEKVVEKTVEKVVYKEVRVPVPTREMTVSEAYSCLGCELLAPQEKVLAGYKAMMQRVHPDRGGSTYLAMLVNVARNKLVKK